MDTLDRPHRGCGFCRRCFDSRLAEKGNNIIHWTDFNTGHHFAAMDVPDLYVGDVRKFFRLVRA